MLSVILRTELERATVEDFAGAHREVSCSVREGGVVVSCWFQWDLSGLPTILPPYPVFPAKHTQTEGGLQCLSGCCGKQSAEDPCERWNYVRHAAPERLAALNHVQLFCSVQLFCGGAMQPLNKRQMVGEGQVKEEVNHKVEERTNEKSPVPFLSPVHTG